MAEHDIGQLAPWPEPDGGFERIMLPIGARLADDYSPGARSSPPA